MANPSSKLIAVLGGGITGLSAAYRLTALGHRVRLFECTGRLGGAVRTDLVDGWLVEGGPNSIQETPALRSLFGELGISSERVPASDTARNRYVVRGGRLEPVPLSATALLTSSLFSVETKARIAAESLFRPRERERDLSVAEFVEEHFGREVLDYLAQPFVSGIYAGDPAKLSAREAFPKLWQIERSRGSILRGFFGGAPTELAEASPPGIISFKRGLQTLTAALGARLPADTVELGGTVERVVPGKRWEVVRRGPGAGNGETFDAVIAALPAPALASLVVGSAGDRPLSSLSQIEHPPLTSLFLGYRRDQVAHPLDGFGVLIPSVERRAALGILFSSSLFPGRAPDGRVALTVMIGGRLQPELAVSSSADALASVRRDLSELLGVSGDPVVVRHRLWKQAIPQYDLGHEAHRATIERCERDHPGLLIGGQARDGISLPQCVAAGLAVAERAAGP